jgi:hypothetical protein
MKKLGNFNFVTSRDSSVGIATDYMLDDRGNGSPSPVFT